MTQIKPTPGRRSGKDTPGQTEELAGLPQGMTVQDLIDCYGMMVLVRNTDERLWMMNRQGKVPIAASCQGHEAAQLGACWRPKKMGTASFSPTIGTWLSR